MNKGMVHVLAIASTDVTASGPDLAWIIAALGLGLVLWAAGGGIMRPAVAALGLAAGAIAGRLVWLESGVGPEWVLPLVGALATTCVALLAWHLASGMLLSLLAALLAASVTWGIASIADSALVPPPPVAGLFGLTHPVYEAVKPVDPPAPEAATAAPADTAIDAAPILHAALRAKAEALGEDFAASQDIAPIRMAWALMGANSRFTILVASGIAALLGLLLAALARRTAAIVLTAVGGGLLVIGAIPRLAATLGANDLGMEPSTTALVAIGAWLALAVLGIIIQMAMAAPPPPVAAE